jgi:hypothetical protein
LFVLFKYIEFLIAPSESDMKVPLERPVEDK